MIGENMYELTSGYRKFIRHYPATIIAGVAIFLLTVEDRFIHFDVFKTIVSVLDNPLYVETEEIAFSVLFFCAAIIVDHTLVVRRHRRREALEEERLKVARSTLASVHDVVNNSLNNLLLVKMEAEKGEPLPAETLDLFGKLIDGMAVELKNMSELDIISRRDLSQGMSVLDTGRQ